MFRRAHIMNWALSESLRSICACAMALGLAVSAVPAFAQSKHDQGVATHAFDVCSKAEHILDPAFRELSTGYRWLTLSTLSEPQHALLSDGVLAAMSVARDEQIDWVQAQQSASATVSALENNMRSRHVRTFYHPADIPSLLIAFRKPDADGFLKLHCIFAGPVDEEMKTTLDTAARIDKKARLIQASEGLDVFSIRLRSTDDNDPPRAHGVDAQLGVFTKPLLPHTNRKPAAQLGFSLIRFIQK